jgi:predicted transposase YbfD/YdcC
MEREYIQEKISGIEDKRHQSYVEHALVDILIIIMSALLCGLDQFADIMVHAQNRAGFFKETYGIEKIPSKPTLSRVLNMMDGDEVGKVIIEVMKERAAIVGDIIAVDGKAIRSTSELGKPHSALQILTAYLTESCVVIGQNAIHDKTNEIPVFQAMLGLLDIKGKTITADAMHCQKETCQRIVAADGHYVFGLKENQKTLFNDVALFIGDDVNSTSIEKFQTIEKGHGRIEKRICQKVTDIGWLSGREEWAGLQSVFAIRRIIITKHKTTDETCYYITSSDATAEELLRIVREHWKIESMHWILDVVFSEDECALLSENGHKTLNMVCKPSRIRKKRQEKTTSNTQCMLSIFQCSRAMRSISSAVASELVI